MQKTNAGSSILTGNQPRPKKIPRWRDKTDEEQWAEIYRGRAAKEKARPRSVQQAVALALPPYLMHQAIADCHATFQAVVRHDVHTAIVAGIAKVSSLLLKEQDRKRMANQLDRYYDTIRKQGFYLNNREFLYAVAHATVTLADDWRYPPDAPACMAALMLKEDAETDEVGDWSLSRVHAIQQAGLAYNAITETGLYAFAEDVIKRVD